MRCVWARSAFAAPGALFAAAARMTSPSLKPSELAICPHPMPLARSVRMPLSGFVRTLFKSVEEVMDNCFSANARTMLILPYPIFLPANGLSMVVVVVVVPDVDVSVICALPSRRPVTNFVALASDPAKGVYFSISLLAGTVVVVVPVVVVLLVVCAAAENGNAINAPQISENRTPRILNMNIPLPLIILFKFANMPNGIGLNGPH